MNKKITLFAGAAVVIAGGLIFAIRMNQPASTTDARGAIGASPAASVMTQETDPYTHVASIPATVDPSTIRFEKLKMVQLASKTQTSSDPNCKEKQFRDPDGSNCDAVKVIERVKAVEASYSFIGPQVASFEGQSGPTRSTFAVYFRPEELPVSAPVEKLNKEQASSLFQVNTSRPMVQQKVVDKANSHFCEGKYVDGAWTQNDQKCQEQLQYMMRPVASEYWAVAVDMRHPANMSTH